MKNFLLIASIAVLASLAYSPPTVAQQKENFETIKADIKALNEMRVKVMANVSEEKELKIRLAENREYGEEFLTAQDLPDYDILIKQHEAEKFYRLKNLIKEIEQENLYRNALFKKENQRKSLIRSVPQLE